MEMRLTNKQRGVTTVEFAIVALVALTILFGAIEVGRFMFTANTLQEATRRGARMAAVCTYNSPAILRASIFNSTGSGTTGPILNGLTTANIRLQYIDDNGNAVTGYVPGDPSTESFYYEIAYVQVDIVNFNFRFFIPGLDIVHTFNGYPTIMPRESLGVPPEGQTSTCT